MITKKLSEDDISKLTYAFLETTRQRQRAFNMDVKNGTAHTLRDLENFGKFHLVRVLQEKADAKAIFLEGRFPSIDPDKVAIVILNKTPFNAEKMDQVLTSDVKLQFVNENDVYSNFNSLLNPGQNLVKTTIIYPANQRHIQKYLGSKQHIIEETPQIYRVVTKPFLAKERFSTGWVDNILDHKSESEKIIFEDKDPTNGFILLPDLKWNGKQLEDLYLICITHDKNLKSIRDLVG